MHYGRDGNIISEPYMWVQPREMQLLMIDLASDSQPNKGLAMLGSLRVEVHASVIVCLDASFCSCNWFIYYKSMSRMAAMKSLLSTQRLDKKYQCRI